MAVRNESDGGKGRTPLARAMSYLRPALAITLLIVLFAFVPPKGIVERLSHVRIGLVAVAFVIAFAAIVVSSFKLWLLVRTASPQASLLGVLRAYYVGTFFNNFLPTGIGGDVFKINELRAHGVPVRHATACVVVERATGIGFVLVLATALALAWGELFVKVGLTPFLPLAAAGATLFVLMCVTLHVLWTAKLKPYLKQRREGKVLGRVYWVAESFYVFRDNLAAVFWALAMTGLFYVLVGVNIVVAARAVEAVVSPAEVIGIIPVMKLSDMLPSLGGLGVREGAITYCLARLGPTATQAAAVALLLRLLTWAHSGIGGCVYALRGRRGARRE